MTAPRADYFSSSIFNESSARSQPMPDDLVVSPPTPALLETRLHHLDLCGNLGRRQRRPSREIMGEQLTSSAIGPMGSPSGGSQKASATKNPRPGSNVHHRAAKHAAEAAEHLVLESRSAPTRSRTAPRARGVVTERATCHHAPSASASKKALSTRLGGALMTRDTSSPWDRGCAALPCISHSRAQIIASDEATTLQKRRTAAPDTPHAI